MSRAKAAKAQQPESVPPGPGQGPRPSPASPRIPHLAVIERMPPREEIAPREGLRAKVPVEALVIGGIVAISYLNAALHLFT